MYEAELLDERIALFRELQEALQSALDRNRTEAGEFVAVLEEPAESWRFWRWFDTHPEQAKVAGGLLLLVESNRIGLETRFRGRIRAKTIDKFSMEACFSVARVEDGIHNARHYIDVLNRS